MLKEQEKVERILYLSETSDIDLKNSGVVRTQVVKDYPDGDLYVAETSKEIQFKIKRVYWINNFTRPDAVRGKHAHQTLRQVIFCTRGCFTLLLDNGVRKQSVVMDTHDRGIYLGPLLWHEMTHFSQDCGLLVLASDLYKEEDYIRNYQEFSKLALKGMKRRNSSSF